MSSKQFIGLLKFFNNEEYLNDLMDGVIYCNTPEFYRLSNQEGLGDFHESCVNTFRKSRGDEAPVLKINGQELEGLTALTTHKGGAKDKWLHCWFALDYPQNDDELVVLTNELNSIYFCQERT
jgi:hypothetical protein